MELEIPSAQPLNIAIESTQAGDMSNYYTKSQTDAKDARTLEAANEYAAQQVPVIVSDYVNAHKDELKGDTGPAGAQGAQGERGEKGEQGERGEKGADGLQGERGVQGVQGIQGEQGERGERGADGAQGIQGERGADGADGYSPVRGTDYWTDADIAVIKGYVDDAILGGVW